jgi:methyltransferase FkbM-like protein
VSLNDLLRTHNAPREIDFMSVDTEGSEGDILKAFDFGKYDVKVMTVEHNFVEPKRGEIHDLLTANGFVRIFEALSKFDDWYVKRAIVGL